MSDLIERDAVIAALNDMQNNAGSEDGEWYEQIIEVVRSLAVLYSDTPEPPCPTNHTSMHLSPDPNNGPHLIPWSELYPFCPDCGARLVDTREGEQ